MRVAVVLSVLCLVALNAVFVVSPALADDGDEHGTSPAEMSDRFVPRPPGVEREMVFYYGPFTIPPGQDNNRVTLDLPVQDGFLTSVQANVYDAATGETPSNQDMHIHHAHWFRTSEDPEDEYYTANLAWVFGTGEERTKGDINMRSDADPNGPSYGIFIEAGQPQALIYMLHNKNAVVRNVYVVLEVSFVYGAADAIADADGCDELLMEAGDTCRAGEDFHHLYGKLWGTTFDVPREFGSGDGIYVHPVDIPETSSARRSTDDLGRYWTVAYDATAVGSAGHLHPNGIKVVIANLGPEGSGCEADLDGDGYPGTTLFHSDKIEMVPEAFPHSEEYQMGVTKPGWRAPVRAGDRLTQFGVYDNGEYASYEAMSYTGFYMDRQQPPAEFDTSLCESDPDTAAAELGPYLISGEGSPLETILNHEYHDHSHGHCGIPGQPECNQDVPALVEGDVIGEIHIANFAYVPGDQSLSGPLGEVPQVVQGEPLTVVNEDVALGVRHTLTTCDWPCNGPYVANYPQPDGVLDTGKLGNLDYIDGGLVQTGGEYGAYVPQDTNPVIEFDTSELDPGMYSYYCRIHPWMRGWFEVVEPAAA